MLDGLTNLTMTVSCMKFLRSVRGIEVSHFEYNEPRATVVLFEEAVLSQSRGFVHRVGNKGSCITFQITAPCVVPSFPIRMHTTLPSRKPEPLVEALPTVMLVSLLHTKVNSILSKANKVL